MVRSNRRTRRAPCAVYNTIMCNVYLAIVTTMIRRFIIFSVFVNSRYLLSRGRGTPRVPIRCLNCSRFGLSVFWWGNLFRGPKSQCPIHIFLSSFPLLSTIWPPMALSYNAHSDFSL